MRCLYIWGTLFFIQCSDWFNLKKTKLPSVMWMQLRVCISLQTVLFPWESLYQLQCHPTAVNSYLSLSRLGRRLRNHVCLFIAGTNRISYSWLHNNRFHHRCCDQSISPFYLVLISANDVKAVLLYVWLNSMTCNLWSLFLRFSVSFPTRTNNQTVM